VQDGRQAGHGAGLDVGRAAHDHAGHRQGADRAAQHVADALGEQLLVVLGARPSCMRSTAAADSRVSAEAMKATARAVSSSIGSASGRSRAPGNGDGRGDRLRHDDLLDVEAQARGQPACRPRRRAGRRDQLQRLGTELLPQPRSSRWSPRRPRAASTAPRLEKETPPRAPGWRPGSPGRGPWACRRTGRGTGRRRSARRCRPACRGRRPARWRGTIAQLGGAGDQLDQAGDQQDRAQHRQAVLGDDLEDDDGQAGGGAADLQGRTGEAPTMTPPMMPVTRPRSAGRRRRRRCPCRGASPPGRRRSRR
jgi:hypothetical protein